MARIDRRRPEFDVLSLANQIAGREGLSLTDHTDQSLLIENVKDSLRLCTSQPQVLHGHRTEAMFGYVAASLGHCSLVKKEDTGIVYVQDDVLQPDYLLKLQDGSGFLVEVKNCHKKKPPIKLGFQREYIDRLQRYTALLGLECKLAVYWSIVNMWTLTPIEALVAEDSKLSVTFPEIALYNEMVLLGDRLIGLVPPLRVRICADTAAPRAVSRSGEVKFRIGSIELYTGEGRISDPTERNLVWYFALYGGWSCNEPTAEIVDNELVSIEYTIEPEEQVPGQGFDILGSLSSMISLHYLELTSSREQIRLLSPSCEPQSLGVRIPKGFKGDELRLWQFSMCPNELPAGVPSILP